MGINRSRRVRNLGYQRDKFSSARIQSAKYEAKTLLDLVEEDVDHLHDYTAFDTWASSDGVVTGLPDAVCFFLVNGLRDRIPINDNGVSVTNMRGVVDRISMKWEFYTIPRQ